MRCNDDDTHILSFVLVISLVQWLAYLATRWLKIHYEGKKVWRIVKIAYYGLICVGFRINIPSFNWVNRQLDAGVEKLGRQTI